MSIEEIPKKNNSNDLEAGFQILDDFARFDQKNDVFRRAWWDDSIKSKKTKLFYATYREPLKTWRKADGYTQKDYALRNAAWHVSDLLTEINKDDDRREGFSDAFTLQTPVADTQIDMGTEQQASDEIKKIALEFGAGLVGITNYDNRWEYSRKFSDMSATSRPAEIPDTLNNVIVIAQPMDYELVRTVPSALSGSATGLGYSHDALTVLSLTQYIRNLGYEAIGSMNDTSLAIPYAIKAGLGEYGRHGLLITPKYGPRIRLGKVYTNLPLAHDRPIRFGVKEFCEICRRCTKGCPVKAIPDGPPSKDTYNQSNILGVKKWSVDGEKCFGFWAAQNTDCSICIRVCPYNKDYSRWLHKLGLRLAGTRLRHFMLWLDVKLGYGERQKSSLWWQGVREKLLARYAKIIFRK